MVPYHSHVLLLLNHVVIVVNLCCVEALTVDIWISNKHTFVNKSRYCYYYYYYH